MSLPVLQEFSRMLDDRSRRGRALPAGCAILRFVWLPAVVAVVFSVVASAQVPARPPASGSAVIVTGQTGSLPSARSILDRHLQVVGGREAVLRHSSTVLRGTLSMPKAGLTGNLVMYRAKPNKSIVTVT